MLFYFKCPLYATEDIITLLPRNIVVEDKRPTQQAFMMFMEGVEPWGDPEKRRDPGDLFGITFQGYPCWSNDVQHFFSITT